MKLGIAGIVLACALAACTPSPVTPPAPDASDASLPVVDAAPLGDANFPGDVAAACANLRVLGCKEGAIGVCEPTLAKEKADRLTRLGNTPNDAQDLSCVVAAKSGGAVRACAPTWASACQ